MGIGFPGDPPCEIWGGIECTVNRVGDRYQDQVESTGHSARIDDLKRIAELGIRVLRYPVLWERTAPGGPETADWSWPDERLAELRRLGIGPILGLVHHGSGPPATDLLSASFAQGLARFAAAVAERYPWVEDYTPVNEPLTTARFSGLYGHWYPHGRDAASFCRALLNQCRAVVLAMEAIRRVNPRARLVQTEDLGKTHSTPNLSYQAEFENLRRWLTFDILTGRLDLESRMGQFLRWVGIADDEITWFLDHPCPPDILGLNYYMTSERFLDDRLERYPASAHGGNGRHRYVDLEAVRGRPEGLAGLRSLLQEAWDRYGLPMAVTELHLGCTREEQLRWFHEGWQAVCALRREGVDIRAVTAWSLLGAYDWNSLMVRADGSYEPGVFDLRGPAPRPTALAGMIRQLAGGEPARHPVLASPGWWRRPERLIWGAVDTSEVIQEESPAPPVLVTGARGTLGQAFVRILRERGLACHALTRSEMDIADPDSVRGAMDRLRPWAVINAAGYVRVDEAEHDCLACTRENTLGPAVLAEACAEAGARLMTFSSDLVFDGSSTVAYCESDPVNPTCMYGRSKAEAEQHVASAMPDALVVRTSAFFGPWDQYNFLILTLRRLAAGLPVPAADDLTVSPTYVPDLVHACLDLLIDGESGIWHLANSGAVTWHAFALQAAQRCGMDERGLQACSARDLGFTAARPRFSVLGSEKARLLPSLDDAIGRYAVHCLPLLSGLFPYGSGL